MAEWPWRYRSRSLCDTQSHASDHLCLIWKELIQNCRNYRVERHVGQTDGRTETNIPLPHNNNFVGVGVSCHNEKSETLKAGCAFSAILVKPNRILRHFPPLLFIPPLLFPIFPPPGTGIALSSANLPSKLYKRLISPLTQKCRINVRSTLTWVSWSLFLYLIRGGNFLLHVIILTITRQTLNAEKPLAALKP